MASKLCFVFVALFVLCQVVSWGVLARPDGEAATKQDASKAIDEALNKLKTDLNDVLGKLQNSDLLQNLTSLVQELGTNIQSEGKALAEKIQKTGATN